MEERTHTSAAELRFSGAVKDGGRAGSSDLRQSWGWKQTKEGSGEKAAGSSLTFTYSFRMPRMLACTYSRSSRLHLISGPSGGWYILAGYWNALCSMWSGEPWPASLGCVSVRTYVTPTREITSLWAATQPAEASLGR